jgi:protein SCO1/2
VTRSTRYALIVITLALTGSVAVPLPAHAGNDGVVPRHEQPRGFRPEAGITEHIGAQVPLDLVLRDENDKPITLGDAINGKPTILVPVYYRCPMLCSKVLTGLLEAVRAMPQDFSVGGRFNIVTLSMDPLEHGDLARSKKKTYLHDEGGYGRPGADEGWRFLTGKKENLQTLFDTVGFRFEFDKMMKEYNHPAALIILSPQGKVTRYFYGLGYDGEFEIDGEPVKQNGTMTKPKTTLRLSLIEAAEGKGGSLADRLLLLCYRYDAMHQGHSLQVLWLVRIGGIITLLAVLTGVLLAVSREGLLRTVLVRIGIFALVCVAISGLGLGSSLLRSGDDTLASVLLTMSFLSVLAVSVIAYYRARALRSEPPAPPAGPTDALPSGGTA